MNNLTPAFISIVIGVLFGLFIGFIIVVIKRLIKKRQIIPTIKSQKLKFMEKGKVIDLKSMLPKEEEKKIKDSRFTTWVKEQKKKREEKKKIEEEVKERMKTGWEIQQGIKVIDESN